MACTHSHEPQFEGLSPDYKRRLIAVMVINFAGFAMEMSAGALSGSQALKADALDFFADGVTYLISFLVIGQPLWMRSSAAIAKGLSLLVMGLWVAGSTLYQVLYIGMPQAEIMGIVGFIAMLANLVSVWLLMDYAKGDANVRSVWLCSRNDAIGNVAVMGAAGLVFVFQSGWPDLVVAGLMAALFLHSATRILIQALTEMRGATQHHHHEHL
ncbi:cation transporter [Pelagibacterium luteolum]|uniref:Co/Zn/Cd efflux system component n=1 Tax=Pelagibacterium luteolum TaxID=440168 RepID=A0A1G7VK29_9HYPH|nr:cation transporter [Pelagibacterium luteolum]SDG59918.1 Co/Zn/Cd efflux system component [Pelagibacterium luteolum]